MKKLSLFMILAAVLFCMGAITVINLASQVTGTLPQANGGSGVTSFSVPQVQRLVADSSGSSSATLATTGMTFPVAASTKYNFECYVMSTATSVSGGLFMGITGPASPTNSAYSLLQNTTATAVRGGSLQQTTTYSTTGVGVVGQTITTTWPAIFSGTFENGSTAGTLTIQFANGSSTGSTVLKRGSFCMLFQ